MHLLADKWWNHSESQGSNPYNQPQTKQLFCLIPELKGNILKNLTNPTVLTNPVLSAGLFVISCPKEPFKNTLFKLLLPLINFFALLAQHKHWWVSANIHFDKSV